MDEDLRATQVYNTQTQQQQITQILTQLNKNNHINPFFILSKYLDCPEIKNQPQFMQTILLKHKEIIVQLLEWMLIPKQLIKNKKIRTNVDSYPYQCRQFFKDNWCFYQHLYISVRMRKFQFGRIFDFLRKEHFDDSTIFTALGYFADVMIPFVKYQFSASFNLTKTLTEAFVIDAVQTYSFLKLLNNDLIDELINYCFYEQIFQFIKTIVFVGTQDSTQISEAKQIFRKLLASCKFFSSSFMPLQQNQQKMSNVVDLLQNLSNMLKQLVQTLQLGENQKNENKPQSSQKQIIEIKFQQQIFARYLPLFQAIVQENILQYFVNQLKNSKLCGGEGLGKKGKNKQKQKIRLYSSMELKLVNQSKSNKEKNMKEMLTGSAQPAFHGYQDKLMENKEQQQIVQVMIKIVSSLVEIYQILPKCYPTQLQILQISQPPSLQNSFDDFSPVSSASSPSCSPHFSSYINKLKKAHKQPKLAQYTTLILSFNKQILYLFSNLQFLTKLVINVDMFANNNLAGSTSINGSTSVSVPVLDANQKIANLNKIQSMNTNINPSSNSKSSINDSQQNQRLFHAKVIPFASGQNIKIVSIFKYQYFKLLVKCIKLGIKSQKMINQLQNQEKQQKNQQKQTDKTTTQQKKQNKQQKPKQNSLKKLKKNSLASKSIKLPPLVIQVQKLYIVQIIKKYICQNKWNNIAQVVLIEICHIIVTNYYSYMKKSLEFYKSKKFVDSFLAFLIENFNKRDYVFLNTVKFTTQGNLYALYKMSKDIAYTLNNTNELAKILGEFEPWKKFIMNDLKNYQEKLFSKSAIPVDDDYQNEQMSVKIDQADSIRKLVENISQQKKIKRNELRAKSLVRSSHTPSSFRNIDEINTQIKSASHCKERLFLQKQNRQQKIINQFRLVDAANRNQINKNTQKQRNKLKNRSTITQTTKLQN